MMNDTFDLSAGGDDSFGPGSDLILSLLALSLLLVGVLGSGTLTVTETVYVEPCEGPACMPEDDVQDAVSLIDYNALQKERDDLERERDDLQTERDEFRALSDDLMAYANELRALYENADPAVPPVLPQPTSPIRVGSYRIEVGALDPAKGRYALSAQQRSNLASDLQRRTRRAPDQSLIEIRSTVPGDYLARLEPGLTGEELLSNMFRASTEIANSFQAELLRRGVPLACIELKPVAYSDRTELQRAVTRRSNNLDALEQLQSFYKSRPERDVLSASAEVQISFKPDQDNGCSRRVYLDSLE